MWWTPFAFWVEFSISTYVHDWFEYPTLIILLLVKRAIRFYVHSRFCMLSSTSKCRLKPLTKCQCLILVSLVWVQVVWYFGLALLLEVIYMIRKIDKSSGCVILNLISSLDAFYICHSSSGSNEIKLQIKWALLTW